MLEVKNASVSVGGQRLFAGLSFAVDDGQTLCVTGPSGVGKTTLLKALMGFVPLDDGHISIDGELLTPSSAEEFRKMMAYVPQELSLPTEWVRDMVRLPFGLKINRDVVFSKSRLLEEWGMLGLTADLYDKKVAELSGGERQRVMLSVAGILGRQILLTDEPTSALDAGSSDLVAAYFRNMASHGTTVIAVTHDPALASGFDMVINLPSGI